MIINLDVEGLKEKKADLEKELSRVQSILDLLSIYSASSIYTTPTIQTDVSKVERILKRHPVAGKRKAVTMVLNTGPATESEIAQVLGWSVTEVNTVLASMLLFKLVFLNEHGKLQLSTEGKKQATWFTQHPNCKIYCPSKVVK